MMVRLDDGDSTGHMRAGWSWPIAVGVIGVALLAVLVWHDARQPEPESPVVEIVRQDTITYIDIAGLRFRCVAE